MIRLRPTLIALSLVTFQTAALAATPDFVQPTRSVSFAQADLERPGGTDAILHRIRQAARAVCAAYDAPGLENFAQMRRCISDATARAIAQAHAPRLTQRLLAESRTPILPPVQARLNR
jgi:UrcA family protein